LGARKQVGSGTSGRIYYLYDGGEPAVGLGSAGTIMKATDAFGASGLLSRRTGGVNGTSVFYTFDPQGDVCQRFANQGALLSSDEYDAWGALLGTTQTGSADVSGAGAQWGYYTGSETGLLLLTNRYYDPGTGRFVTRDPIGYAGGINLYGYVGNGPASFADPDGLIPRWGAGLAGGAVGALGGPEGIPEGVLGGLALYDAAHDLGTMAGSPGGGYNWDCGGPSEAQLRDLALSAAVSEALPGGEGEGALEAGTPGEPVTIEVPNDRYPGATAHMGRAQSAGRPVELTIDRLGADARRDEATGPYPRVPGMDRDEYPPAFTREGGAGSSVEYVRPGDNRGAGAYIGARIRGLPDGSKIRLVPGGE
jgi:RHS repeat-associated protein